MQIRPIIGFMILGFLVTLAAEWRELADWRAPHALARAPLAAVRWIFPTLASSSERTLPSTPRGASSADPAGQGVGNTAPIEAESPGDGVEPALPVMVAFRTRRAPPGDSPANGRELDLLNTSDQALTITVLIADAPRAQLFMLPRDEEHLGTEAGLELEPGSPLTLRSAGYRELTETVR